METSHFIPTSSIGKPGWYNKFREQNCLLNQSSSKITIISNLDRYPEIWEKKLDHNPPEELVNGVRISGISVKKQCRNATVVLIPLLPRGKKDSIRGENINITNRL